MDFSSTFSIEVSKLTPSGRSSSSWVSRNFSKTFFPQHFQRLFSWYGNLFVIELAMTNTLTASRRDPNPYPKKIPLCWTLPVWLVVKISRQSWRKRERILVEMWVSTTISIPGGTLQFLLRRNLSLLKSRALPLLLRKQPPAPSLLSLLLWVTNLDLDCHQSGGSIWTSMTLEIPKEREMCIIPQCKMSRLSLCFPNRRTMCTGLRHGLASG